MEQKEYLSKTPKFIFTLVVFMLPSFAEERELEAQGYHFIAGIDEAGRGAIAGPVVAAAVILPRNKRESPEKRSFSGVKEGDEAWLSLVRDSKRLSPKKREALFERIQAKAIAIGVGMVSPEEIDAYGIIKATCQAMFLAVKQLPTPPDFLLIDALTLPQIPLPQKGIIHGDQISLSIACASIIAKVTRDRYMIELDKLYSGYGLARHKGYATPQHLLNLHQLGPCPIHRCSFSPVKQPRLIPG